MLEVKIRPKNSSVWVLHLNRPKEAIVVSAYINLTIDKAIISYEVAIKGSSASSYKFYENEIFDTKEDLKKAFLKLFDE